MRAVHYRIILSILIVGLLLPVAYSGVTASPSSDEEWATVDQPRESVTFVSYQGRSVSPHRSGVVAYDTETKETLWKHTGYRTYFDVDPIGNGRIAVVAGPKHESRLLLIIDWRNDTVLETYRVGKDTHDATRYNSTHWAVADMHNDSIDILNESSRATEWTYDFREQYPGREGAGGEGWTHVNDVDVHANGSLLLTSPRNFDRVALIEYPSKDVRWELGHEDDYSILNEQHNPVLLSRSPPTVLVADSANDRIVEYQRRDSEWKQVWVYQRELTWPRDADRLPNGNTLIVDSGNDRSLEVAPNGSTVWELHSDLRLPYDIERTPYGEEPAGPSYTGLDSVNVTTATGSPLQEAVTARVVDTYFLAGWVLPGWVSQFDFILLLSAVGVGIAWAGGEALARFPARPLQLALREFGKRTAVARPVVSVIGWMVGIAVATSILVVSSHRTELLAVGLCLITLGYSSTESTVSKFAPVRARTPLLNVIRIITLGAVAAAVPVALATVVLGNPDLPLAIVGAGLAALLGMAALHTTE
jgi:hypothetical protein